MAASKVHARELEPCAPILSSEKSKRVCRLRNCLSFWIFGACSGISFAVMLSAAFDILAAEKSKCANGMQCFSQLNATISPESLDRTIVKCNAIGTGAVLLADILPCLLTKSTVPLFLQLIPDCIKIISIAFLTILSLLIVAFSPSVFLSLTGIVFTGVAIGIADISFLSLTALYQKDVISTWSSGSGAAGLLAAFVYAGLTSTGLNPRMVLLIMIVAPVLMLITYIFILKNPVSREGESADGSDCCLYVSTLTLKQKISLLPFLFKYMIPLAVVFFAEYFINQGLHELLCMNDVWLTKEEQYRWFAFTYQIGVFVSRSSVNCVYIRKTWILACLQVLNVTILMLQVFFRFLPSIWIIFACILWEGLLGGSAYVNTFYRMSLELDADIKEFCLGAASLGDTFGISLAGAFAIPVHNLICDMNTKM